MVISVGIISFDDFRVRGLQVFPSGWLDFNHGLVNGIAVMATNTVDRGFRVARAHRYIRRT
jgi:hypothetical protein